MGGFLVGENEGFFVYTRHQWMECIPMKSFCWFSSMLLTLMLMTVAKSAASRSRCRVSAVRNMRENPCLYKPPDNRSQLTYYLSIHRHYTLVNP